MQLRHDHESQERFLAELAGPDAAAPLRVLLERGAGDAQLLDRLAAGTERRLGLSPVERERLELGLARGLAPRATRAGPAGRRTIAWAARRDRRLGARIVLLPAMPPLRAAGRGVRTAARSPALARVRSRARRSRVLRGLYSRLG